MMLIRDVKVRMANGTIKTQRCFLEREELEQLIDAYLDDPKVASVDIIPAHRCKMCEDE